MDTSLHVAGHTSLVTELVGSAGNAPVVASGLFEDTGFTGRQPDHFPKMVAGAGVAPTEGEVMGLARIWFSPQCRTDEDGGWRMEYRSGRILYLSCSVLAAKWWRTAGNAPACACLQGRCIPFLPRPRMK